MSECLKDEKYRPNARHLSGILFKNTVLNTTKDNECDRLWNKMADDERDTLKNSLLEALACENKDVMRAAGSAISAVALLEIPQNRWLDVIDKLCNNITHELDYIRQASLLTLGYICEELSRENLKKEQADYVISAFLQSLKVNYKNNEDIIRTIQGLYHSLKFAVKHFEDGHGGTIMQEIFLASNYDDVKVRTIAMQCIVEIVRLCYAHILPFMREITDITYDLAQKDEVEVKAQAIEVWASIAEEENMRLRRGIQTLNIIDTALSGLLGMIQYSIQELNIGNEEDEDQEWGSSVAASCCLSLVSQVVGDKVVDPIYDFATENLDNSNWEK